MKWIATVIAGEVVPDDGCLVVNDTIVARVYRRAHSPDGPKWHWFWQKIPASNGAADTKDEAKAECERRARDVFGPI